MHGAAEYNISNYVTNNFAALLFKHDNQYRVVISVPGQNSDLIVSYNISQKVYLSYKIDKASDFKEINLIASNQYGTSSKYIPVQFEGQPNGSGLAWYIILVIVLGSLAVVGFIVFLVIKYKKGKAISKDSLLSVSKQDEEDE